MQQLGHTDPAFTLRVHAHTMRRSEDERERLKALVQGDVWVDSRGFGREIEFLADPAAGHWSQ